MIRLLATAVLLLALMPGPQAMAQTQSLHGTSKPIATQESLDATALALSLSMTLSPQSLAKTRVQPRRPNATVKERVQATAQLSTAASEFTVPFSRLIGDEKPVRLAGVASSLKLSLPLPALMQAQAVRLELSGTASRALISFSQLEVAVNGRVVRQVGLGGGEEDFRHSIRIPVSVLREGFNEVQITVAQHYHETCEYPMASQLWTDIHLRDSHFVVTASPTTVPARLDQLDALFDKAVFADAPPVSILTADAPQADVLRAAGLVAQGLGHRYDYVPIRIHTGRFPTALSALDTAMPTQARVVVVMGTFASLASYLKGLGAAPKPQPVCCDSGGGNRSRTAPGSERLCHAAHVVARQTVGLHS